LAGPDLPSSFFLFVTERASVVSPLGNKIERISLASEPSTRQHLLLSTLEYTVNS
jgi:hypothetical protein